MISKEFKSAIDNYADQIQTLENFVESVRVAPGMYLGELGAVGWISAIREILQNGIDQILMPDSPANYVRLEVNAITKECTVTDNGLGLPFEAMERILLNEHTSKNYHKKKGEYASGRHGVGAKVVNALSEYFIAESYRYDGKMARLETKMGYPTTKDPVIMDNPDKLQGTKITFKIDDKFMSPNTPLTLDEAFLMNIAHNMMYQTPIGSTLYLSIVREDGSVYEETIINEKGIYTALSNISKAPIISPIHLFADNGTTRAEIAFTYDQNIFANGITSITAFANLCPTSSGTHIDGFVNGVSSWFTKYMNTIYLAMDKRNKLKVIKQDVLCGLTAMIFAAHLMPTFDAQQKTRISNPEFTPFIKQLVLDGLDQWAKDHPDELTTIAKYLKDVARIRTNSEKEKVKVQNKYKANSLTGLPQKYYKPMGKKDIELIIVEGDSAGGSAKTARDEYHQGIMPIRGKMPNAFKKKKEDIMANAEVQALWSVIFGGKGYKPNFDIKDVKVSKIVIMADADVDGNHIACLVMSLFIVYAPQLIEAGMVYKAVPPLYGIQIGTRKLSNGKMGPSYKYFTDRLEVVKYVQKDFVKRNSILLDNKELKGAALTAFLRQNEDYLYEIRTIATRNFVDPELLEMYLVNKFIDKKSIKQLEKLMAKRWRFSSVEYDEENDVYKASIVTEGKRTMYINDILDQECANIIEILKNNSSFNLTLNGASSSLYNIMDTYDKSKPKKLQRFKGLGEMDSDALAESTLLPDNRVLIRYTMEDAKYEYETIKMYNANSKKLLEKLGVVSRTELLGL